MGTREEVLGTKPSTQVILSELRHSGQESESFVNKNRTMWSIWWESECVLYSGERPGARPVSRPVFTGLGWHVNLPCPCPKPCSSPALRVFIKTHPQGLTSWLVFMSTFNMLESFWKRKHQLKSCSAGQGDQEKAGERSRPGSNAPPRPLLWLHIPALSSLRGEVWP